MTAYGQNREPKHLLKLAEKGSAVFFRESILPKQYLWHHVPRRVEMLSWGEFHFYPRASVCPHFSEEKYLTRFKSVQKHLESRLRHHPLVNAMLSGAFKEGTFRTAEECLSEPGIPKSREAFQVHSSLTRELGVNSHGCLLVLNQGSIAITLSCFAKGLDFNTAEVRGLQNLAETLKEAVSIARTSEWSSGSNGENRIAILSARRENGAIDFASEAAKNLLSRRLGINVSKELPPEVRRPLAWGFRASGFAEASVFIARMNAIVPFSIHLVNDGENLRLAMFNLSSIDACPKSSLTELEVQILRLRAQDRKGADIEKELGASSHTRLYGIKRKLGLESPADVRTWYRWIGSVCCRDMRTEIPLVDCGSWDCGLATDRSS